VSRYRKYLQVLFAVLAALLLPLLPNLVFMRNIGELTDEQRIAALQQDQGGLYGTATTYDVLRYKKALMALREPEVVALGSSRVMQFRQEFFRVPFANLGGTVSDTQLLRRLAESIAETPSVKVVILGFDFWWTNRELNERKERNVVLREDYLSGKIELGFVPLRWLADGRISSNFYRHSLAQGFPARIDGIPAFGANAAARGNGFAPDGSYMYNGVVYGLEKSADAGFAEIRDRIVRSVDNFGQFAHLDHAALREAAAAIDIMQAAGKRVVVFAPPLATAILNEIERRRDSYLYLDEFLRALPQLGADAWHSFHDPRQFDSSDCEFVDGIHGGDVTYARIVLRMAEDPGLARAVDRDALGEVVRSSAGRASGGLAAALSTRKQVDFLELGCVRD